MRGNGRQFMVSSEPFFFSNWTPLIRIVAVGVPMYIALVVFLRISGSRTLSDMNAFDFIVTVAIGSVFGRALTAKSVTLAEAVVSLALLIVLQYTVSRLQLSIPYFERIVTNPPSLLYFRGEFLDNQLRRQRVSKAELQAAVRKKGPDTLDNVEAVVLESSGEFSVIESVEDATEFGETLEEDLPG